jgi:hypothetical protein
MRIVKKSRKHPAILWRRLGDSGRGYYTYEAPVQIKCRWDDVTDHRFDEHGVSYRVMAEVIMDRETSLGDALLYGKLANLKFDGTDPLAIPGVGLIKKIERYATLRQKDLENHDQTLHVVTLGR